MKNASLHSSFVTITCESARTLVAKSSQRGSGSGRAQSAVSVDSHAEGSLYGDAPADYGTDDAMYTSLDEINDFVSGTTEDNAHERRVKFRYLLRRVYHETTGLPPVTTRIINGVAASELMRAGHSFGQYTRFAAAPDLTHEKSPEIARNRHCLIVHTSTFMRQVLVGMRSDHVTEDRAGSTITAHFPRPAYATVAAQILQGLMIAGSLLQILFPRRPDRSNMEQKMMNQRGGDDHFPIENVPRELIHRIIALVPFSLTTVIVLRTMSKTMKAHADNYAIWLRTDPEIDKLKISGLEYKLIPGKCSSPFVATVYVDEPSKVVLLKLAILQSTDCSFRVHFEKFPLSPIGMDVDRKHFIMRRVVLKIYEDDDHCLDFLRNFLKDSMIVVQLFSCKRTNTWDFVSKLLEKSKKIKILEVDNSTLTEECLIRTRQMAKCLAIYQIVLRTYRCTASEVVESLMDLASQVHSIYIYQLPVADIDKSCRYLLGKYNVDWSSIIIQMISKKLSGLVIENEAYPEYLSANCLANDAFSRITDGRICIFKCTEKFKVVVNNHTVEVYEPTPLYSSSNQLIRMRGADAVRPKRTNGAVDERLPKRISGADEGARPNLH
ncbi:hypothetical protein PRIPAC_81695 [Pristionchus pacificus]|uniref:Uncharacterized protein n=1 Tax=Pristionchus pacificus TaxID=54126 RepID=A0A2A6BVX5_PRIPA|nr:hypothetical protein PRIPAC_81695 [Pristionchus pacificus]|eukprot:PDM70054.1 hypothetical protein PRIPAC_49266 [Pristionchus pacificus]